MSGVFGQKLGRKNSRTSVLRQFGQVLREFRFRVSPGEVRIGLCEPQLGEPVHDIRPRECFSQKNQIGMFFLKIANHPFPEIEGFRMRIIDAKDADTLFHPELNNGLEFLPQCAPLRRLKFEGIDVFILLGRIFRILHGTVRPLPEPFGMLLHIRMIRRTLVSKIESNVDANSFGHRNEAPEVFKRAEFRMDRFMSTVFAADSPRTAGVTRLGCGGVVSSLSMRHADRVDGWEIENIKSHFGDFREHAFAIT